MEELSQRERRDAIKRLEDAVDIMTDMAHIRRNSHAHGKPHMMEISPALIQEAIEAFNLFDKDNDHGLDLDELATVFKAMGQRPSVPVLEDIIQKFDLNKSGRLEREEFENMIATFMKPKEELELELKDAFRVFDRDGNGFIDREELEKVLKKYGEPLTRRQSRDLLELMDKDKNGKVDVEDFVKFVSEVDRPDYFRKNYPLRQERKDPDT